MSSDKYFWPGWAADPEEGFGAVLRYSSSGGLEFHDGTSSGTFHPLKENLLGIAASGSGGESRFLDQTGAWRTISAGNGLQYSAGTFSLNLGGGTAGQYLCLDSDGSSFTWKNNASPVRLTDLTDVSSGDMEEGYALCWNGSAWQASSVAVLGPDGISAAASQAAESKINETKLTDLSDVSSSGLASGGVLCYNGSSWRTNKFSAGNGLQYSAGTFSLNLGSGTAGQYLCLGSDGSSFTWKNNTSPVRLTDLSDVSSGDAEEGYALCWNGSAWQASSVAVLGPDGISAVASQAAESKINETKLTDLSDVSSSGLASGGVLCYNGSSWQTSQFSSGTASSNPVRQQIEIGSGKEVADLNGLQAAVTQAVTTCAVLTDDEYPGGSAIVLSGGEIELRWDAAHQSANEQVVIRHPLIFSGCGKVKLEGIKVCPEDSTSHAIVMSEGGLLRMNYVTCEHCSKAVFAVLGGLVFLENKNCFGSGVDTGLYLVYAAKALTRENEMLNLATYRAVPWYGESEYQMASNATLYDSSALTDNGIIIRTPNDSSLISANFLMNRLTISSGSRISVGPNADGREMYIASGGLLRVHLEDQTNFTGSSGRSPINISSGVWSGFSGNVSSMIVGTLACVHHFSGSAYVRVERYGTFSSSYLTGGTLAICSGGTVANIQLGTGVTSTRL